MATAPYVPITVTRVPSPFPRTRLEPPPKRFFLERADAERDPALRGHFRDDLLDRVIPDRMILRQGTSFYDELCLAIGKLPGGIFVYQPGGNLKPRLMTLTNVWLGFFAARCGPDLV
jgi:hypothetical protein